MTDINIKINEELHCVYSKNYSQEVILVVLETLRKTYDNVACDCCTSSIKSFVHDNLPSGIYIKEVTGNVLFEFED